MNGASSRGSARRFELAGGGRALIIAARSQFWPASRNRRWRWRSTSRPASRPDRAAAQVDAEHVAVRCALLQQRVSAWTRRTNSGSARRRRESSAHRVEQRDQVDVAGIVELARAVLAERQHDEAAAGSMSAASGSSWSCPRRAARRSRKRTPADRRVGKASQRLGRLRDVPDAAEVGERDQQRRLVFGAA